MKFDWLIIGAGYSACVLAERIATQLGQRVLIVEKRNHIGGNAYDYYNEHGHQVAEEEQTEQIKQKEQKQQKQQKEQKIIDI